MRINPVDRAELRRRFNEAKPFRHVVIENFLPREDVERVAAAYPTFEQARERGFMFDAVNERKKVQITDSSRFPAPVKELSDLLASQEFRDLLVDVTGIPKLLADEQLAGGGMHVSGARGRLDVHVDFNYVEDRQLHRRLNILLYLNPVWDPAWGGAIELWDREVATCHQSVLPVLNRCVIFETSEISFHGVTPITCPPNVARHSFAAYYYTKEPPPGWKGEKHSTIFRARPDERFRRWVVMPAEAVQRRVTQKIRRAGNRLRRLVTDTPA